MSETPQHTLYVHNLNDQIKTPKLKENLYVLFSTHGEVVEINFAPTLRGQAFVVYTHPEEAKKALRSLQDTVLFGKQLKVEYAKTENKKFSPTTLIS